MFCVFTPFLVFPVTCFHVFTLDFTCFLVFPVPVKAGVFGVFTCFLVFSVTVKARGNWWKLVEDGGSREPPVTSEQNIHIDTYTHILGALQIKKD